ncbi:MAG TPA: outer membrane protein assembly factor BamD [Phycisphaerales bacterium]|nr:outer membrane protein assembly factor BamD [Phycisphaerales bacterium]
MMRRLSMVIAAGTAWTMSGVALAQVKIVDEPAGTPAAAVPAPQPARAASAPRAMSADEQIMLEARRLLANMQAGKAQDLLDAWIERNAGGQSPQLPEAYYLRGNAKLAQDDEYDALYDYEEVIKNYPASEFFVTSLERELDVAKLYFAGRNKPGLFGIRMDDGVPVAEEIVLRINERMPGSKLAERALMTMADHYASERDLPMAVETYETFVKLYPRSEMRQQAMQRRTYATVAQFKGPAYDSSVLTDASIQVENFQLEYPGVAQEAGLTDGLQARLDESRAASMLNTAQWYIRRDDPVSARLTLVRLVKRHAKTASAQEALALIAKIDEQHPAIAGDAQPLAPATKTGAQSTATEIP